MEFKTLQKAYNNNIVNLTADLKLSGLRATTTTTNEAIKKVYKLEGKIVGWKAEGKNVKKAYTFWSGKKSFTIEDKEFKFFNICKDDLEGGCQNVRFI